MNCPGMEHFSNSVFSALSPHCSVGLPTNACFLLMHYSPSSQDMYEYYLQDSNQPKIFASVKSFKQANQSSMVLNLCSLSGYILKCP